MTLEVRGALMLVFHLLVYVSVGVFFKRGRKWLAIVFPFCSLAALSFLEYLNTVDANPIPALIIFLFGAVVVTCVWFTGSSVF